MEEDCIASRGPQRTVAFVKKKNIIRGAANNVPVHAFSVPFK
jgi:hypothetical protein